MARMPIEKPLGLVRATGTSKNYNFKIRIIGVACLIYNTFRLKSRYTIKHTQAAKHKTALSKQEQSIWKGEVKVLDKLYI